MEKVPTLRDRICEELKNNSDFQLRETRTGRHGEFPLTLCWFDGLISSDAVSETVLKPLEERERFSHITSPEELTKALLRDGTWCAGVKKCGEREIPGLLLSGFCVLFSGEEAVAFEVKSDEKRGVEAPKEEKVVKGSHDAFTETLRTNTALVRKKLRSPTLCVEETEAGRRSHTKLALVYLSDCADPALLEEMRRRLGDVEAAGLLNAALLEEQLCDAPKIPFPQLITTERPDKFAMNLLEGRVGVLADGLPMGFLAPGTFSQFFKVPEDLSQHFIPASVLTVLRYISFVLTLLLPGFYVAAAMYHQELLPVKLMQSVIDSRLSVPFPTAFEVLAMLLSFELLQEAGLRLPSPVGQTVSIVGALIVGQSAVEARVVSPVVVVVVAMSGVAGYVMPSADMGGALRLWRFLLVLAAAAAGFFGLVTAGAALVYRLCDMDSFGTPYMTPFSGGGGLRRALTRSPARRYRPEEPALRKNREGDK